MGKNFNAACVMHDKLRVNFTNGLNSLKSQREGDHVMRICWILPSLSKSSQDNDEDALS